MRLASAAEIPQCLKAISRSIVQCTPEGALHPSVFVRRTNLIFGARGWMRFMTNRRSLRSGRDDNSLGVRMFLLCGRHWRCGALADDLILALLALRVAHVNLIALLDKVLD